MNPTDKPRVDSKLKTLAEGFQTQIADFAVVNSLSYNVALLRDHGTETSISGLFQFLSLVPPQAPTRPQRIRYPRAAGRPWQAEPNDFLRTPLRNRPTLSSISFSGSFSLF